MRAIKIQHNIELLLFTMQIHTFALAAFSLQWLQLARAFPNFSGTCLAGPNIMPEGTTHFGGNQGTLSDGGFQVQITGLGNMEDGIEIEAGKGYGVTIPLPLTLTFGDTFSASHRMMISVDLARLGSLRVVLMHCRLWRVMEKA